MDNMPMFDDPIDAQPKPKKPKPKPTRKRRRKLAVVRKQRVARSSEAKPSPSQYFDAKASRLIGELMQLEIPLRNFVMEVTKALTK